MWVIGILLVVVGINWLSVEVAFSNGVEFSVGWEFSIGMERNFE